MAHQLGKDIDEILAYPVDKFVDWIAYFQIKNEEEAKAMKKGNKGKGKP